MTYADMACIVSRFMLFITLSLLLAIWSLVYGAIWREIRHIDWKCWGWIGIVGFLTVLTILMAPQTDAVSYLIPLWVLSLYIIALLLFVTGGTTASIAQRADHEPRIIWPFFASSAAFAACFGAFAYYWWDFCMKWRVWEWEPF